MIEKREVIDTYIEKQKEDSLFGTINNFLGSLGIDKKIDSPFGGQKKINEYIDLYLGGEAESDENQKENSENIKNNVTEQLGGLKGSVRLALLETELSITCGYFSELKELLQIVKENRVELGRLKQNIEEGLEFDAAEGETSPRVETEENLTYSGYENLKPLTDTNIEITQEDVDFVNQHAPYIVENLQIKGELAKIKNIKNKEGEMILDCKGLTPFVNKEAAADLVGVALMFYRKTEKKLNISSAYRTMKHQAKLVRENANKRYTNPQGVRVKGIPTAKPGESGHNLGYSIDIERASRYSNEIGGVSGLQKIMGMFNFSPISSEDRHFDHKIFVDNFYNNRSERPMIAQNVENSFENERQNVA
ncbi:MAG TPA: D-alanyl-D-alanine carboxypeptidase family protein [Candidatus Absconditabacterales bacterium]|nr:D-alanyl-D-alanine carboxypeptidase family protein [Candidatus Absconditabacterales bacterium]